MAIYPVLGASQVALVVKNLLDNAGDFRDTGPIPETQISPGGGHSNSLQYSCLENPMDRGAWKATVHRVAKSWTRLNQLNMHACCSGWVLHHLGCALELLVNIYKIKVPGFPFRKFWSSKTGVEPSPLCFCEMVTVMCGNGSCRMGESCAALPRGPHCGPKTAVPSDAESAGCCPSPLMHSGPSQELTSRSQRSLPHSRSYPFPGVGLHPMTGQWEDRIIKVHTACLNVEQPWSGLESCQWMGDTGGAVVKNLPASAGDERDACWIPGLGRSPGVGNGNSLQYSCLVKPMDRGA